MRATIGNRSQLWGCASIFVGTVNKTADDSDCRPRESRAHLSKCIMNRGGDDNQNRPQNLRPLRQKQQITGGTTIRIGRKTCVLCNKNDTKQYKTNKKSGEEGSCAETNGENTPPSYANQRQTKVLKSGRELPVQLPPERRRRCAQSPPPNR